jgi:hypothetical protein
MTTTLLDVMWGFPPEETPKAMAMTGGIGWREPGYSPSPRLLLHGQAARAGGQKVRLVCLTEKEALEQPLDDQLGESDQVVIAAPAIYRHAAERLASRVRKLGAEIEVILLDPWAGPTHVSAGPFGYDLATGTVACQAEVDVLPLAATVHPWVAPAVASAPADAWKARLDEATRTLTGAPEARFYLNDDRVAVDLPRLVCLAETVSRTIKEQDVLLELHVRAWPEDLCDPKLLDYLTLLPLGSLDILAGSFVERSLEPSAGRPGRTGSLETVERAVALVNERGLSHLASLSLALALPGETADDVIGGLNRAFAAAARARIRRRRLALWLGDGGLPTDSADQDRRFLASHPDWHKLEYRGIFDFVALVRDAMPQTTLIGPGLVAGWEPPAEAEAVEEPSLGQ